MALNEKIINTRIVLTHDEYSALSSKKLKAGEVVLAKVGTTEANGKVSEPIWMMKVGDGTSTVASCPWLVAPAADVYDWAKKENLEASALPAIPGDKLGITVTVSGTGNAVTDASWDAATKTLTLTKGETFATKSDFDDHTHNDKADKVTGAVAGNFAGLDANGNLTDSGSKASDFAVAGHNHDDAYAEKGHNHDTVYKKLQTAVSETGAADKTLTISQNANGEIKATPVDIAITSAQVTDFESEVTAVVNGLGITTDGIADLNTRLGTAEGEIDALQTAVTTTLPEQIAQKVAQSDYDTKVQALEKADSDLDTAVKAAQADATSAKTAIEAFLKEADSTADAIDTLKEIQAELDADDEGAAAMLSEITKIKDGSTVVSKAADADTVDGKHADDFAEAGHNHDDAYSKLGHKHAVADITDYETDVAAKIKVETDARTTAISGLQDQIDGIKTTADAAVKSVTANEATGLKVDTANGVATISFIDDVVFVLDGGTSSNLD